MSKISLKVLVPLLFSALVVTSCSSLNSDSQKYYNKKQQFRHGIVPILQKNKVKRSKSPSKASVKRGKQIYMNNCYSCHGEKAQGNGPQSRDFVGIPRDLLLMVSEVPDFKLFVMYSKNKGEMPGWRSLLSDKELDDVENYILHLASKE